MTMEPNKLHARHKRHLDELKKQIAHCLDKELNLLTEERRERTHHLGIHEKLEERRRQASV